MRSGAIQPTSGTTDRAFRRSRYRYPILGVSLSEHAGSGGIRGGADGSNDTRTVCLYKTMWTYGAVLPDKRRR